MSICKLIHIWSDFCPFQFFDQKICAVFIVYSMKRYWVLVSIKSFICIVKVTRENFKATSLYLIECAGCCSQALSLCAMTLGHLPLYWVACSLWTTLIYLKWTHKHLGDVKSRLLCTSKASRPPCPTNFTCLHLATSHLHLKVEICTRWLAGSSHTPNSSRLQLHFLRWNRLWKEPDFRGFICFRWEGKAGYCY